MNGYNQHATTENKSRKTLQEESGEAGKEREYLRRERKGKEQVSNKNKERRAEMDMSSRATGKNERAGGQKAPPLLGRDLTSSV